MNYFNSNNQSEFSSSDDHHGNRMFETAIPLKGIKSPYLQVNFIASKRITLKFRLIRRFSKIQSRSISCPREMSTAKVFTAYEFLLRLYFRKIRVCFESHWLGSSFGFRSWMCSRICSRIDESEHTSIGEIFFVFK
jgi:hypothetical protein